MGTSDGSKGIKMTADNFVISMGAPEALKSAAEAWSPFMNDVRISISRVPGSDIGFIRVNVADPGHVCVSATMVEVRINHLGKNVENHPVMVNTKQLALVLKQIVGNGAMRISYDLNAPGDQPDGLEISSLSTYSRAKFFIPVQADVGAAASIPLDNPATIEHAINLSVDELRSFMSCFNAIKAEFFNVRIRSDGHRVLMTLRAESSTVDGMHAEKEFYGTRIDAPHAAREPPVSTSTGVTGLRSARILKLDENKLEQPVVVGERENVSEEEIEDAVFALNDAETVTDTTYMFLVKFSQAFLCKLDLKSKLTMAIVVPTGGSSCLFLRGSTPKSVTEIYLSGSVEC